MMFHNLDAAAAPHMADVRVREAIDLAVDRDALSQDLAGGTGTRSFFPSYSPYHQDGLGVSHADLDAAAAKLDEAGWTVDAITRVERLPATRVERRPRRRRPATAPRTARCSRSTSSRTTSARTSARCSRRSAAGCGPSTSSATRS